MEPVIVRRSGWRVWALSLTGVPLVVIGVDVLFEHRIVDALRRLVFTANNTQLLETRDLIWGWVILVVGVALVGWGLKELISPGAVLIAGDGGLHLAVRGPWAPMLTLPWDAVTEIRSAVFEDEGQPVDVLIVGVDDPALWPAEPWHARRIDDGHIAVLASGWELAPDAVAPRLERMRLAATLPEPIS